MYKEYIEEVLIEVTSSPHFRESFLNQEPFETMDLDVTNIKVYTPWVTSPCIKYGLRFYGYKTDGEKDNPNSCLIIIVAADHPNIFRTSYNNLNFL